MCYEYDWMQNVTESEEARKVKEKANELIKQPDKAPPQPAAAPETREPVPA
jgi:hypothetical protein